MKYIISFFIILLSLSFTQDRSVVITGTCLLEGENNHSGIEVLFEGISSSATTTSAFTESDGSYISALNEGLYNVRFIKNGFLSYSLVNLDLTISYELETITLQPGEVIEISGNIDENTRWTDNFEYHIVDTLNLNSGDTLTIDPGVNVLFMG